MRYLNLWNPPSRDEQPCRLESEGRACFLEYWLPEKLNQADGSLRRGAEICRTRFRQQCKRHPQYRDVPMADFGKHDLTEASYTKGMLALGVLYHVMEEQAFLETYRSFRPEYAQDGACLEDFVRHLEKSSAKDLRKFLDDWIYGTRSSDYLLGDMPLEVILELYKQ